MRTVERSRKIERNRKRGEDSLVKICWSEKAGGRE